MVTDTDIIHKLIINKLPFEILRTIMEAHDAGLQLGIKEAIVHLI